MPKKMKVRLTKKIHAYRHEGHRYFPGDIVEIEESAFRADFMEKWEPPKPTKKKTEEAKTDTLPEDLGLPPKKIGKVFESEKSEKPKS